ncbi:MAG: hypothetical protein Q9198_004263 [Flavoplaca austrocitrina]
MSCAMLRRRKQKCSRKAVGVKWYECLAAQPLQIAWLIDPVVVKIYEMLREADDQYNYYHAGFEDDMHCGQSFGLWAEILGASCRDHVVSGYKFIMRYYSPGDAIHMFGVARGAHTACVLARMLQEIGLLRRGNEHRAETAWKSFADKGSMCKTTASTGSDANESSKVQMETFKKPFCQDEVSVELLGLFDCTSPAGHVDGPPTLAQHVRHAVTIRQDKGPFQGMLFDQKVYEQRLGQLWFAGAHKRNGGTMSPSHEDLLNLNDIPLAWMLNEVQISLRPHCVLRFGQQWEKLIADMVDALKNDVMGLIPGEAGQAPSTDESGMTSVNTGSPADTVMVFWKMLGMCQALFAEAVIFILRFLIFEPSPNHYEQQAGCRLFHPSVFSLYKKGVLCIEDTPQSIVAASKVIDNEHDSTSDNATFSIMNQAWCWKHGNEAWRKKYGSQKLEDLIAGKLEIEPTTGVSEQDGNQGDFKENESQPAPPSPRQQAQTLKMDL